ncbi:MAG TPA: hypothetical protein VN851_09235 [Thermoanaerobaculia bacterium]|nr:hypothetical protein [Thermoanaerobaculia bacterium]
MKRETEANSVLHHLAVTVYVSGLKHRKIDTEIGWARGTTNRVLKGQIEIKIRHLLEILNVCKVPSAQFFAAIFRETGAPATATRRIDSTVPGILSLTAGLRPPVELELVSRLQKIFRDLADQLPQVLAPPDPPPPHSRKN